MIRTAFFTVLTLASVALGAQPLPGYLEKIYCDPSQIEVEKQVIYVYVGDTQIEVDTLEVDQGGIFFRLPNARHPFSRKTIDPRNTCEFQALVNKLAADFPS